MILFCGYGNDSCTRDRSFLYQNAVTVTVDEVIMTTGGPRTKQMSPCTDLTEMLERLKHLDWDGASEFPVPPQGVIEFSKLARETNVSVSRLSSIVESEPGLTVELLKSVNSSIYGVREKVDSVPKAISLLGISTCASIFLTKALDRALQFFESPLLSHTDARRESLERARFAREIATRLGLDPILSFTAATLQDILLPFLTRRYEDEYRGYLGRLDWCGIEEFERETFGWTHAEITAKTLVGWGFPESLVFRVLLHHTPPEELFLSEGFLRESTPNAAASLLSDVMQQAPSGVPRLVELQRFHPQMKLLSIADAVDRQTTRALGGAHGGMTLVHRIQSAMLEQIERSRRESIVPGRQFGNYVLEKKLTESSMGAIFKAKHIMLKRPTAIKFLRADRISQESVRQFEREVQLTSTLSHPNTISIFDFGRTSDDLFYYAMEYIEGPTLGELVAGTGAVPDGRVLAFLLQIFGSLAEAHSNRLVHRDIKPENIMLSEGVGYGDRITVLDFGLVTEGGDSDKPTIRGTPLYMSPEAACCSDRIDERSDLYSVAAVAYFLLTGRAMFQGTTTEVLNHQVQTNPVRPSTRTQNPICPELEDIIMLCLRKAPEERPASAADVMTMLSECLPAQPWSRQDSIDFWNQYTPGSKPAATPSDSEDTVIGPV